MFAHYAYIAGATAANIAADVVAILTGTTDPATLSASCDKPGTLVNTTYNVAGWAMHDNAASATAVVLKAACLDKPTLYKYLHIDWGTAGYLLFNVYETWNAVTHAGTIPNYATTTSSVYQQRLSTTLAGWFKIQATARNVIIYGTYSTTKGSSSTPDASNFILELESPGWHTEALQIAPVIHRSANGSPAAFASIRNKRSNGTISAAGEAGECSCLGYTIGNTKPPYYALDAAGNSLIMMYEGMAFIPGDATTGSILGSLSGSNLYFIGQGPTQFDEFVDQDAKTRILFPWASTMFAAVLKG